MYRFHRLWAPNEPPDAHARTWLTRGLGSQPGGAAAAAGGAEAPGVARKRRRRVGWGLGGGYRVFQGHISI